MAFNSSTISIGDPTKKSDYDRLMDNTKYLKSEAATFTGPKTFQSNTVFVAESDFQNNLKVDTVQSRTSTAGVGIQAGYVYASGTASVVTILTKILEIGAWNMNSTVFVEIAHGLSDHTKIRDVRAIIKRDDDLMYDLSSLEDSPNGLMAGGTRGYNATNVILYRYTNGFFDNSNYSSTLFNRGWITMRYEN